MIVRILDSTFDPQAETHAFAWGRTDAGALASFVGYCRAATDGAAVSELCIDHYPGFSDKQIAQLAQQVHDRLGCLDLLVIHRVGRILPGETIVLVAALAVHRGDAFEAVRLLMDYLKTDAPLWKKETGPNGARWVEPRPEDYVRRQRLEKEMV